MKRLSNHVLGLKFMRRRQQEEDRKQEEIEIKRIEDEEHWFLDSELSSSSSQSKIETGVSIVICENLIPCGRRSFRRFNPSVEKIYNEILAKKERDSDDEISKEEEDNDGTAISNEEMASRFESLVQTVEQKFSRKRKRNPIDEQERTIQEIKPKPKFLKPCDS
eukprot:m.31800 g.31800  ORF g.31800 m.31800 type:complete len:164 (+) comp31549_c0_seq4:69-560(+)